MAYFAIPHHRPYGRWCSGRLIRQAETLDLQPLRGLHRSTLCFFFQNAHASGSLRSPSEPRTALSFLCAFPVGLFSVSAPNQLFELLWCSGRLIFRKEYTVLFSPKRTTSRFASLTLRTAHRNLLSEDSGVPHGLFCDSAPSPIRALVFRSAYSASRNARPPAASRPPNPAPSSRFFSISRRSRLRGCRHRAESTHHLTPSGCVPSGGAVAPPAPPLPPPSRCRPDRFKGSP